MKNLMISKNTYLISVCKLIILLFISTNLSCQNKVESTVSQEHNSNLKNIVETSEIIVGANRIDKYLPLLKGKKVAIVANQTSVIFKNSGNKNTHLVDSLISLNIEVVKVFAPEHGFRGKADAGEHVSNDKDVKTGLPIISLYGKNRKPSLELLDDIDVVLFDIQDVGVRFYTYISTMTNVMEACAEKDVSMVVLDRPNPNGHYVDGPTLEQKHKSFLGMHPIPLLYGLTIGEYAKMVNAEKWLKDKLSCNITVIELENYSHERSYNLPIRPSPNLPNDLSINLYPSLGFFEGTIINAGRGTEFQFQRYGAPFFPKNDFSYTPKPNFGSKTPKFNKELCYGVDLSGNKNVSEVNLKWLIDAYQKTPKDKMFFGKTFTAHAGTLKLRKQIEAGLSAEQIRASWQDDINKFMKIRNKYLIYD